MVETNYTKIHDGIREIIENDKLYSYDDINGLKKIIEKKEFKYNYKNIYYLKRK